MSNSTPLPPEELTVLQQILATDTASLSIPELVTRGSSRDESEVRNALDGLGRREFVVVLESESGYDDAQGPFYAATESAVDYLKRAGRYDEISLWYGAFDAVSSESRSRPSPEWV
ncbi:hypothetical protein ACFO0N_01120 [Halobium salinum]|uniref:MarR family transcriptional regulator n=1 Tax=Halobium salinum TaxID=1364940 RepID=A0ABD5P740_9EURY|nr:hypothetical protein [Halobium salinum]